jgi:hypothetical protein
MERDEEMKSRCDNTDTQEYYGLSHQDQLIALHTTTAAALTAPKLMMSLAAIALRVA